MKKATLIMMVAVLVVAFSGLAAAQAQVAPAGGMGSCFYNGQYRTDLTDEQKTQIAAWQQQSLEQNKQILAKQVEWGWITQAQADQQLSWMEQQQAAYGTYGQGMMGPGMHGRGMMMQGTGNW